MTILEINALNGEQVIRDATELEIQLSETIIELSEDEKVIMYENLVAQKIRTKYNENDEAAIQRKQIMATEISDEFQEYYDFCEQCKIEARNEIWQ